MYSNGSYYKEMLFAARILEKVCFWLQRKCLKGDLSFAPGREGEEMHHGTIDYYISRELKAFVWSHLIF